VKGEKGKEEGGKKEWNRKSKFPSSACGPLSLFLGEKKKREKKGKKKKKRKPLRTIIRPQAETRRTVPLKEERRGRRKKEMEGGKKDLRDRLLPSHTGTVSVPEKKGKKEKGKRKKPLRDDQSRPAGVILSKKGGKKGKREKRIWGGQTGHNRNSHHTGYSSLEKRGKRGGGRKRTGEESAVRSAVLAPSTRGGGGKGRGKNVYRSKPGKKGGREEGGGGEEGLDTDGTCSSLRSII